MLHCVNGNSTTRASGTGYAQPRTGHPITASKVQLLLFLRLATSSAKSSRGSPNPARGNGADRFERVPTRHSQVGKLLGSQGGEIRMRTKAGNRLKKVVVMGGSQGAIETLLPIMSSLPADLPTALFVVVHLPIEADSYLPKILERAGHLKVQSAKDGEPIRSGHVYVAPPDYHLTVEGRTVQVHKGPRENRHRPAIDPLFRTAARAFGPGAIAVILSGYLDDGSAGSFAVRQRGGIAIVQDPADAQASEMPRRALEYGGADYRLPSKAIAPKLIELIHSRETVMKGSRRARKTHKTKKNESDREIRGNEEVAYSTEGSGNPSVFACPECHGVLWQVRDGRFR